MHSLQSSVRNLCSKIKADFSLILSSWNGQGLAYSAHLKWDLGVPMIECHLPVTSAPDKKRKLNLLFAL